LALFDRRGNKQAAKEKQSVSILYLNPGKTHNRRHFLNRAMEESRRYEATVAFFATKNGEQMLPEI